jgi:uncharacterized protein (DUF849 family)
MSTPLVIEAALNGSTSKERRPEVPRSVDEVVDSALACVAAGATIVHHHNDEPNYGGPARHAAGPYRESFRRITERAPGVLLYPTMAGAAPGSTIAERYAHMAELHAEGLLPMAMADPGTLNVALLGRDGRPMPTELVYQNTCADFAWMIAWCRERAVPVSISIFEPGFLRLALAHHHVGELPSGAKIQLYFGGAPVLVGLPPTPAALDLYLSMLEGTGLPWMVGVVGGDVTAAGLARLAIERGGHVRVGLEDYEGPRHARNEELVAEVAELARACGRPVAAIDAARTLFC